MKEINLTVSVDEANLLLEAVGLLPFARVYQLVGKLQDQARRQLNGSATAEEPRAAAPGE
jgi:hypothetical protein